MPDKVQRQFKPIVRLKIEDPQHIYAIGITSGFNTALEHMKANGLDKGMAFDAISKERMEMEFALLRANFGVLNDANYDVNAYSVKEYDAMQNELVFILKEDTQNE